MLFPNTTISVLQKHIEDLQVLQDEVVLILFSEHDVPDILALVSILNDQKTPFMGGVFPGLIYGNKQLTKGCIIKKFKAIVPPFCVSGIAQSKLSTFPTFDKSIDLSKGTAIVFVDGLTPNIYHYLEELNELLGGACNVIGGGAGSISLDQQPCIFCKKGFVEDAGVACIIDKTVKLGVRHGWEQLAGPLVATKTEGNTILQLNWENAIDVYNKIVESDKGIALTKENFGSIAQGYPFGIFRGNEDDIVRDPLSIGDNGAIICIGEVPANTVLHILKGRPETLLNAARQAVNDCAGEAGLPINADATFIVDCITRTLFLGDNFAEEIDIIRAGLQINDTEQEPFGILSLGELSSYSDGLLELYNKTIVVGTFN